MLLGEKGSRESWGEFSEAWYLFSAGASGSFWGEIFCSIVILGREIWREKQTEFLEGREKLEVAEIF